jgi:8-amino-7-oxononanoate synthase
MDNNNKIDCLNYLNDNLEQLKRDNLFRSLKPVQCPQGAVITIDGQKKVCFASNNYLNLANNGQIIKAVKMGLDLYGYGSGASRLISGSCQIHHQAENALAEFVQKQAALIFPSGWMANQAIIRTIPQKGDLLLLDKLCHSSIIDAAACSDCQFKTYRKDNLTRLEKLLSQNHHQKKFIITESVFSMDGDCADLIELVRIKQKYGAILIVDEAHSIGCFGDNGNGLASQLGVLSEIDIFIGTLGKAFGLYGGFVASNKAVIDYLINKAKPFIYTTAISPINSCAIIAALELIKDGHQTRQKLMQNAEFVRKKLTDNNIDIAKSTTYIIPVIIGQKERTIEISQNLFEKGYYCPAIRPPTVPNNSSRLRISIQSEHTKQQLEDFTDLIICSLKF